MSKSQEKQVKNSSMARHAKEVQELGKEMNKMSTNQEIKKNGQHPDPIQHEKINLLKSPEVDSMTLKIHDFQETLMIL